MVLWRYVAAEWQKPGYGVVWVIKSAAKRGIRNIASRGIGSVVGALLKTRDRLTSRRHSGKICQLIHVPTAVVGSAHVSSSKLAIGIQEYADGTTQLSA
jgi:X-X-X-Leu-X-X-Gly heptad repeat protein